MYDHPDTSYRIATSRHAERLQRAAEAQHVARASGPKLRWRWRRRRRDAAVEPIGASAILAR